MFIRPVTLDDHAAVLRIAQKAGFGMTSLPPDEEVLHAKIEAATRSFAGDEAYKGDERFLFVMEDPQTHEIVGTTGIMAHVGLREPFYSYRLSTITQSCSSLDLYSKHQILQVVNDLTGVSEIGSLYLLPSYRRDRIGRTLSLARFLFIAAFRDLFADTVIAEMRGPHHKDGTAPFYNSIAKHFFEMEFVKADYINATQGNQFIADLMPKYPIYVSLLPREAQDAIGQAYPSSEPAKAMLENQGFSWQGFVDIFDGGPTMQAETSRVNVVKNAQLFPILGIEERINAPKYIVSNDRYIDFACCASPLRTEAEGVYIESAAAGQLAVQVGDKVRTIIQ